LQGCTKALGDGSRRRVGRQYSRSVPSILTVESLFLSADIAKLDLYTPIRLEPPPERLNPHPQIVYSWNPRLSHEGKTEYYVRNKVAKTSRVTVDAQTCVSDIKISYTTARRNES
jgi:hypothetical protein